MLAPSARPDWRYRVPLAESLRIADQLGRAIAGPAWQGPSLLEAIDDVTAAQAATKPMAGAHSIHELVAHATAWIDIARQRLEGTPPPVTDAMDWPAVSAGDWAAARTHLEAAARRLESLIRSLDDGRLPEEIPIEGDRWSVYETLHGVIQHALYHAGQIAILKKGLS